MSWGRLSHHVTDQEVNFHFTEESLEEYFNLASKNTHSISSSLLKLALFPSKTSPPPPPTHMHTGPSLKYTQLQRSRNTKAPHHPPAVSGPQRSVSLLDSCNERTTAPRNPLHPWASTCLEVPAPVWPPEVDPN